MSPEHPKASAAPAARPRGEQHPQGLGSAPSLPAKSGKLLLEAAGKFRAFSARLGAAAACTEPQVPGEGKKGAGGFWGAAGTQSSPRKGTAFPCQELSTGGARVRGAGRAASGWVGEGWQGWGLGVGGTSGCKPRGFWGAGVAVCECVARNCSSGRVSAVPRAHGCVARAGARVSALLGACVCAGCTETHGGRSGLPAGRTALGSWKAGD